MRRWFEVWTATGLLAAGMWVLTAGCASSSKQEASESEPTASEGASAASGAESAEEGGSEESAAAAEEPEREPVKLETVIGADTSEGLPEGCPEEWNELEGRRYEGTKYSCSGFRVPDRYREPTVIIGVKENTVRQITLQAFYDAGDPIKEAYADVTDVYEKRCDAEGASGKSMSFLCDGYVAQVSHQKRTGALRVILGLENWDMP